MYLPRTWPVGIPLLTDKSFSSWFARIAWPHGATPSELYRIALPGGRIGGIDLDRHACDDLILNLSRNAGILAEPMPISDDSRLLVLAELRNRGDRVHLTYVRIKRKLLN